MENPSRGFVIAGPNARTVGSFITWTIILLCCGASLAAQEIKPDHINQDLIGESVDEYIGNNPSCHFFSDPIPSRVQPRQTERIVLCVPFDERGNLVDGEPNTAYMGISLKTVEATFLVEDGLVAIKFVAQRTDYHRLKSSLLEEFRTPSHLSRTPDGILTWDNGTTRIDLQEGEAGEDVSYVFLHQDKYLGNLILLDLVQGGIDLDNVTGVDGDYLLLKGPENAQVKVKVDNY